VSTNKKNIYYFSFYLKKFRSGRVERVKIKDENDPSGIRSYSNVKIEVSDDNFDPEVLITVLPGDQVYIFDKKALCS
jgi:hypothetical protein